MVLGITFQKKQRFQMKLIYLLPLEDINLGSRNYQLWDSPKHPGNRLKTGLELGYGRKLGILYLYLDIS